MPNSQRIDTLIRVRWAFVLGALAGGCLVHYAGLLLSGVYAAGILTMGIVSTAIDWQRIR